MKAGTVIEEVQIDLLYLHSYKDLKQTFSNVSFLDFWCKDSVNKYPDLIVNVINAHLYLSLIQMRNDMQENCFNQKPNIVAV